MLKKFVLGGMVVVAALLGNACGDDASSDSPAGPADSEVTLSSSSDDVVSSSSDKDEKSSSSKKVESSSSSKTDVSSSSTKIESSSSSVNVKESSSSSKVESSSSKDDVSSSSQNVQSSSSDKPVESSSSKAKTSSSESSSSGIVTQYSSSSSENLGPIENSSSSEESSSSVQETSSSSSEKSSSSSSIGCIYGEPIHDTRDEKDYKTVKIGNQEWMAENLNYNYKKGKTGSSRSVCFDGENANCDEYGQLYPWTVAIDSIFLDSAYGIKCGFNEKNCSLPSKWKGVCPEGWHIPTRAEWDTLTSSVGGMGKAPKMLKSTEKWIGEKEDTKGIDAVCFSAKPAGNRQSYEFYGLGENTRYWTADFYKPDAAYRISMSSKTNDYTVAYDVTYNAYSVRCIKN
ncbi:major paralogous domain-containing protein [Fibrobacter sp. UWT2]|uniref:FISUMP domain-containing protein n=1 Tax=Fibrobacter sp. UWT2 TaxID=1896224 RepID=UPI000921A6D0|nr:FISUMP domain-containing protein [Fibrobacter sp. UWT2]SHK54047.1 major paralogous domain-containing protein [Fibrobacter sp. UWT2]